MTELVSLNIFPRYLDFETFTMMKRFSKRANVGIEFFIVSDYSVSLMIAVSDFRTLTERCIFSLF